MVFCWQDIRQQSLAFQPLSISTAAYTIIVARGTEIVIGIIFAALASRLLFPQELVQRLLALTRQVIIRVRQFGSIAIDPAADKTALATQGIQLVQDLASIESMRASADFESAQARHLNAPIRDLVVAALSSVVQSLKTSPADLFQRRIPPLSVFGSSRSRAVENQ